MDEINLENCYLIEFPKYGDSKRGYLSVIEKLKNIPFDIKRIYYIYDIGDLSEIRGPHAHKNTEQIFITLNGKAKYHIDNGFTRKEIVIDKPNIGIYIGPNIWHYITNFSSNVILLVIASQFYDPLDYLKKYENFLNFHIKKKDTQLK